VTDPTTYQPEPGSDDQLTTEQRRRVNRHWHAELAIVHAEDERTQDVALPDDAPG
jgi:hypothetical protein